MLRNISFQPQRPDIIYILLTNRNQQLLSGTKDRDDNVRQHHWIMSLLDDLETYATLNDLPLIKDRIAAAKTTAKEEIIVKSVQAADEQSGLRDGTVVPLHVYGTR